MSLTINDKEINAVTKLPGDIRYSYFIKRVSDTGVMWGLYDDGWALAEDDNGQKVLPFWPSKEYARLCAQKQWKGYNPEPIDVHEFLSQYISELKSENIFPSVFYTIQDQGVIPSYDQLEEDLKKELSRLE